MTLSTAARKILKATHIAAAGVTLGGLIVLLGLRAMKFTERWWPSAASAIDGVSVFLFDHVILTAFELALLTAFLFALFTKWGFFQHWWVIGKWVITGALYALAANVIAPSLSGMAALSDTLAPGTGSGWDQYAHFESQERTVLWISLVLVAILFLLAVLKPWGMRKGIKPYSPKAQTRLRIIVSAVLVFFTVTTIWGNSMTASISRVGVDAIAVGDIPDGTYSGGANLGYPYMVEVTVQNGRITAVKASDNRNGFYPKLAERVFLKMVRDNRVDVDAVSGATTTSTALRKAVENALQSAVLKGQSE